MPAGEGSSPTTERRFSRFTSLSSAPVPIFLPIPFFRVVARHRTICHLTAICGSDLTLVNRRPMPMMELSTMRDQPSEAEAPLASPDRPAACGAARRGRPWSRSRRPRSRCAQRSRRCGASSDSERRLRRCRCQAAQPLMTGGNPLRNRRARISVPWLRARGVRTIGLR
jgi:hypothetical protein